MNNLQYISEYNKQHYTRINLHVDKNSALCIKEYCKDMQISQNNFMISAAKYIIDHNIPLNEYIQK